MKHLTRHSHLAKKHVAEVERPAINREEGTTLASSNADARKILDHPDEEIRVPSIRMLKRLPISPSN
jgi:hypothetical protein